MNPFSVFKPQKLTSKEDQVVLGKIINKSWKKETLTESQLNHHVHIVGASGFGKTVLLSHIIKQRIQQGKGLLFIDLKGDIETISTFSNYAKEAGREKDVQVFSLSDKSFSSPYNLIATGSATQLRDRVVNGLNWSEEFYKNQSSSFILKLMTLLCWLRDNLGKDFDIEEVLDCCSSIERVIEIGNQVPITELKIKSLAQNLKDFLGNKDNYSSLQGLRTQLESIALSDFGELVKSGGNGIDLFEAYKHSKIIFLFLDSRRYGETAKSIARFILQDLKSTSAKVDAEIKKKDRKPFSIIIDEFSDFAQEDFISFLDRARSSRMSIVVAHQEICDLNRISPEFAGRLMGNTSTLYAFLQKRPESAEMISSIAGTRKSKESTVQMDGFWIFSRPTGMRSVKEIEEFIIHPNLVKSLGVGRCVCIKKYPRAQAHLVEVAYEAR